METATARENLERLFPGVTFPVSGDAILVPAPQLPAVAKVLRDEEPFRLDYLSCLFAVDYPPDSVIEVVYILYSVEKRHGPVTLKVRVPREVEQCRVPSVTPLWRGAEFQEREAYDLYGVTFEGHPDLRRMFMWEGFEGHPMRKDFVHEDPDAEAAPEETRIEEAH